MSQVERLSIEPLYDRPPPANPSPTPGPAFNPAAIAAVQAQQAQQARVAVLARVLAVLQAVALIVSARLLLLLGVVFAFVLAMLAITAQTIPAIGVLVGWCLLIVGPLVWLDSSARKPPTGS